MMSPGFAGDGLVDVTGKELVLAFALMQSLQFKLLSSISLRLAVADRGTMSAILEMLFIAFRLRWPISLWKRMTSAFASVGVLLVVSSALWFKGRNVMCNSRRFWWFREALTILFPNLISASVLVISTLETLSSFVRNPRVESKFSLRPGTQRAFFRVYVNSLFDSSSRSWTWTSP